MGPPFHRRLAFTLVELLVVIAIIAAGKFVMSTKNPRDGVHPGAYKVVISPPTGSADSATYGSADEAMAAASKRAPSKPSGPTFPQKYARADLTPLTQEVPVKGKVTFELKK